MKEKLLLFIVVPYEKMIDFKLLFESIE